MSYDEKIGVSATGEDQNIVLFLCRWHDKVYRLGSADCYEKFSLTNNDPVNQAVAKLSMALVKHEKTQFRPWKCPVESCKYHEYGGPTKRRMEGHHNEKNPSMYECLYKPCPYKLKQELGTEDHMEQA
jgi:hypothetical protein